MENWREIKSAIYNALSDYDCDVYYQKPTNSQCAYFSISIEDEDYDSDDINCALENVCREYNLSIDWDSEADVNLNVYWDNND